jgi:hypothetical protein
MLCRIQAYIAALCSDRLRRLPPGQEDVGVVIQTVTVAAVIGGNDAYTRALRLRNGDCLCNRRAGLAAISGYLDVNLSRGAARHNDGPAISIIAACLRE